MNVLVTLSVAAMAAPRAVPSLQLPLASAVLTLTKLSSQQSGPPLLAGVSSVQGGTVSFPALGRVSELGQHLPRGFCGAAWGLSYRIVSWGKGGREATASLAHGSRMRGSQPGTPQSSPRSCPAFAQFGGVAGMLGSSLMAVSARWACGQLLLTHQAVR